jgi:5-methylcytosine-specific restriction endonuclease McrA
VSTAIALLATTPQSVPSDAEKLGAEITELCSYIYAAESRFLALIREFDEKGYWAQQGLFSCAHWLNLKCGIGMNAAREKLRVAHALAELPKISERFEKGRLSYSKVRAITRIADSSNEKYLLMIADHGTAHHVEKLVSKYRTAKRLQDVDIVRAQYNNREVTHYYDDAGCLVIKARLPAEQGALIVKALEMAMDAAFVGARPTRDTTDTKVHPKGTSTAVTSDLESEDEAPSIAARRADALTEIAETYMNNNESSGSTADRYQVVVHVHPKGTSTADQVPSGQTSHIEDGPGVTAVTSRRIACDSSVVCIKEDKNGEPLSIGRRSRSIPPPMRRALRARDKGCRFPGCTHTRFVDGHHIKHWADGGDTSLNNLVLLCRHHHHLVHEGGFACSREKGGTITFKDQREQPLDQSPGLSGVAANDNVQQWIDREFFEADIDSETCSARWYAGERMDWQAAVSALF